MLNENMNQEEIVRPQNDTDTMINKTKNYLGFLVGKISIIYIILLAIIILLSVAFMFYVKSDTLMRSLEKAEDDNRRLKQREQKHKLKIDYYKDREKEENDIYNEYDPNYRSEYVDPPHSNNNEINTEGNVGANVENETRTQRFENEIAISKQQINELNEL